MVLRAVSQAASQVSVLGSGLARLSLGDTLGILGSIQIRNIETKGPEPENPKHFKGNLEPKSEALTLKPQILNPEP